MPFVSEAVRKVHPGVNRLRRTRLGISLVARPSTSPSLSKLDHLKISLKFYKTGPNIVNDSFDLYKNVGGSEEGYYSILIEKISHSLEGDRSNIVRSVFFSGFQIEEILGNSFSNVKIDKWVSLNSFLLNSSDGKFCSKFKTMKF